jgi:hypothetical protein
MLIFDWTIKGDINITVKTIINIKKKKQLM